LKIEWLEYPTKVGNPD